MSNYESKFDLLESIERVRRIRKEIAEINHGVLIFRNIALLGMALNLVYIFIQISTPLGGIIYYLAIPGLVLLLILANYFVLCYGPISNNYSIYRLEEYQDHIMNHHANIGGQEAIANFLNEDKNGDRPSDSQNLVYSTSIAILAIVEFVVIYLIHRSL